MRFTRSLLIVAFAALATACADGPTGAISASDTAELKRLAQAEAAERARVALEAQSSQHVFDSASAQFSLLGDVWRIATSLVLCEPQPYTATVKIIGPEGGRIQVGQHTLEIPVGALKERTVITAERPVSYSVGVRFSPHGLEFQRSAKVTLDYSHCSRLLPLPRRVAYVDEKLNILEYPLSIMLDDDRVAAKIDHFSRYAVAY